MKPGSALLSLVIGMLIASSVFIVLINSLNQFIKIDLFLNNNIDQTKRFIIAFTQIENDLIGTCVLHQATRNKQKKSKDQETEKNKKKNPSTKNEKKPLKECFLLKGNPTDQVILSMITSNGKDPYWPKQTIANQSFIKRITYTIEKDAANKQSFRLMRHESTDTTFIKPQKAIVLLDHIASMDISVSYRVYKKEKKLSQQESNQKSEITSNKKTAKIIFKTTQQWNDSFVYEQEDTLISRIPDAIIITYELFDNNFKNKSHHAQTISLISEGFNASTKKTKAPKQIPNPSIEKKEEKAAFPAPSEQKKQPKITHNKNLSNQPALINLHYNQGSSFFNSRFPEIALQLH